MRIFQKEKPSLIIVKSTIGYASPLAGKASCHGAPLGEENIVELKKTLGWECAPFEVPEEVFKHCKKFGNKGKRAEKAWKELFKAYAEKYPELICRSIACQFITRDIVAMFEFSIEDERIVKINERHYKIVDASSISSEDLLSYRTHG